MAQGLFASLLIGTIIKTLGQQTGIEFLVDAGTYASSVAGPTMAASIGFACMSYKENGIGGLVSQGIGTSTLQMPNIIKNPKT